MFTAGFLQFCPVRGDVERNIAIVENGLSGTRADLVVLPELANSGYLYAAPHDLAPYAEAGDGSGPFLTALCRLAKQTGGVIVAGFAESSPHGLYNSAAAVSHDGVIRVYRKTHLFAAEQTLFLAGDSGFQVFEHNGVHIGLMVCFDWFFPESARTLALMGAQIIAHPSNLVLPYCQQSMATRSLENSVFSITSNRYGREELGDTSLEFTGRSQLLDSRGRCLLQAPQAGDLLAVTEIEPGIADDKWITATNHIFGSRRPEMYL